MGTAVGSAVKVARWGGPWSEHGRMHAQGVAPDELRHLVETSNPRPFPGLDYNLSALILRHATKPSVTPITHINTNTEALFRYL